MLPSMSSNQEVRNADFLVTRIACLCFVISSQFFFKLFIEKKTDTYTCNDAGGAVIKDIRSLAVCLDPNAVGKHLLLTKLE